MPCGTRMAARTTPATRSERSQRRSYVRSDASPGAWRSIAPHRAPPAARVNVRLRRSYRDVSAGRLAGVEPPDAGGHVGVALVIHLDSSDDRWVVLSPSLGCCRTTVATAARVVDVRIWERHRTTTNPTASPAQTTGIRSGHPSAARNPSNS